MTQMIDSITVTRANIFKGAARLLVSDPTTLTSFPGRFESIMNASTYALEDGWTDLGPTSEDGVTIRREAELSEGIPLDQRRTNLDEGEPENWSMEAEANLMETTLENIDKAWEAGTLRAYASDGSHAAQHALDLDAPGSFTERMAAFIQEDPKTDELRVIVFRKMVPMPDGTELSMQKGEASGIPFKFRLKADESISEGSGQFGRIYELD